MTMPEVKSSSATVRSSLNRMGLGAWMVVIVLLLLLATTVLAAYLGWTLGDADVPASGYIALALGVIVSLAFGFGLMALVFYSSRKGYDEPPILLDPRNGDQSVD